MPRVSVVLNPKAGRGSGAKLRPQICASLPEAQIFVSEFAGHAEELAGEAVRNGAEIVVAAGGDGTLNEVLNGILAAHSKAKIAILPVGTGNDFARTLGINTDFQKAIKAIEDNDSRLVDVGKITLGAGTENERGRFFLNVCGTGFDALVAARINAASSHKILRHLKGTTAYLWAVVSEVIGLKSHELVLNIDGEAIKSRAVLCAIANAKSYGGGMLVAPQAEIDDGLLDVVLIEDVSRMEFLRAFPGVFSGKHLAHPKVRTFRGRQISISGVCEAGQMSLPVLVDGENLGSLPVKFDILPSTVEFLAPKS